MTKKTTVTPRATITPLFILSGILTAVFSIWAMVSPAAMGKIMGVAQQYLAITIGWFIMFLPVVFLGILLFLAFHPKFKDYKLGGKDAVPEYSTFSWLAMLFTSSIGVGIIYFAINEPIYAYYLAPSALQSKGAVIDVVKEAFAIAFYHWGPQTWSIFGIAGLVVAYFAMKHKTKFLPGEPLMLTFGDRKWSKPVGLTMNVLACVCSALTIATTIGLGSGQLVAGVKILSGGAEMPASAPFIALFALFVITCACSVLPTSKGMKVIGDINVYVAIGILVFTMFFGPTRLIFETIFTTIGGYLQNLIPKNFQMFLFAEDPTYVYQWDVVNLQWWLSWTPFMGVFVASISKGRTLKQFGLAILSVPAIFMVIWISAFGGIAMYDIISGANEVSKNALQNAELTFFAILRTLPFPTITTVVTIILLLLFLATTVVSAALALSRMTDKDGLETSPVRSFIWCVLMSLIAIAAIIASKAGGNEALNGIKALATTMAFPYIFFFLMTVAAFIKQIRKDSKKDDFKDS